MKKILALAVGMLLIPFTAFGMEAMSDGDMDSITGQSGVAISLSNIQIYSDGGGDLWYETTVEYGVSGEESTQAVGILTGDAGSYTFINAIADPSQLANGGSGFLNFNLADGWDTLADLDPDNPTASSGNLMLRGSYDSYKAIYDKAADASGAGEDTGLGFRKNAAVLNIRVVDEANSVFNFKTVDEAGDDNFAAVEIGLPTLEIYNPEGSTESMNIVITGDYTGDPMSGFSYSDADIYKYGIGTIYTGGESTTAILGGRIGITSYGQIADEYKTYGLDWLSP